MGEIALVSGGVEGSSKRNATVRSFGVVELLILDKTSFLDLDPSTLSVICEEARYRTACSKKPRERDPSDVAVLMARTQHLRALAGRSPQVHYELCRAMVYRKVDADTMLARKNAPATSFFILMSGAANAYAREPKESPQQRKEARRPREQQQQQQQKSGGGGGADRGRASLPPRLSKGGGGGGGADGGLGLAAGRGAGGRSAVPPPLTDVGEHPGRRSRSCVGRLGADAARGRRDR